METRDRLWCLLETLKYKEYYIDEYNHRASVIETVISLITMATSLSSIAAWSIWTEYPGIWSIIIMISQIIQLVQPKLPYSRRMTGIRFLLPHLRDLIHDAELLWLEFEKSDSPDLKFDKMIVEYRRKCYSLEETYLGEDMLPSIKKLDKNASSKTTSYFDRNYGCSAE